MDELLKKLAKYKKEQGDILDQLEAISLDARILGVKLQIARLNEDCVKAQIALQKTD